MDRDDTFRALEYLVNIYFDIDFTSSSEDEIVDSVIRHAYIDATNQGAFNTRIKEYQNHYSDDKSEGGKENFVSERLKEARKAATDHLRDKLDKFEEYSVFTNWHDKTCEALMMEFKEFKWVDKEHKEKGKAFTYGNAQKWVNMTIKNIYVLYLVGKLVEDNLGPGYKKFLEDYSAICDKHEDFHLPVDSYIIDEVCREGLITKKMLENNDFPRNEKVSLPQKKELNEKKIPSECVKGWSQWDQKTYNDFITLVKDNHREDVFAWECKSWIKAKKARNNNQKRIVSWPEGAQSMEIYVLIDDDVPIPHFHVRKYDRPDPSPEDFSKDHILWEAALCFDSAEYLKHGVYEDLIPSRHETLALDTILRKVIHFRGHEKSYWQIAIDEWNRNNKGQLPPDLNQPDYTELKTS